MGHRVIYRKKKGVEKRHGDKIDLFLSISLGIPLLLTNLLIHRIVKIIFAVSLK